MSLKVALRHRMGSFSLDVAFEAPAGVTALFGKSGAGKTTVVNAVAGLLRPDFGYVAVDGEVLLDTEAGVFTAPHRRRLGYVFQDGRLFPHMSVRQNLVYGARKTPDLEQIVDVLGLGALLDRRPDALSGGEKQRVAIGRALLADPRILLMDEPLAALDEPRKAEILPMIDRIARDSGRPVLYVSHAVSEVARLANTLVILADGKVTTSGPTADVMSDPECAPLLGLREAGSVLPARIVAHADDGLTELKASGGRLFLPRIAAPPGTDIRLRVHAQDVMLALSPPDGISALNVLKTRVLAIHAGGGPGVIVALASGDDRLLSRVTLRSATALNIHEGMEIYAILKSVAPAQGDVTTVSERV